LQARGKNPQLHGRHIFFLAMIVPRVMRLPAFDGHTLARGGRNALAEKTRERSAAIKGALKRGGLFSSNRSLRLYGIEAAKSTPVIADADE